MESMEFVVCPGLESVQQRDAPVVPTPCYVAQIAFFQKTAKYAAFLERIEFQNHSKLQSKLFFQGWRQPSAGRWGQTEFP